MKYILSRQIKKGVVVFTVMVLNSSFVMANFENVDCLKNQKELGISSVECQVLEKLWETTDGENWLDKKNWDTLTKVSSWEGITIENNTIVSLSLYANNLKGRIPEELGLLSNLRELYLSNNQLNSTIPNSIGSLKKIRVLKLYGNNLSGEIPSSLGKLVNLEILSLAENNLTGSIPQELGNLSKLTYLDLKSNSLSGEIPVKLGELKRLTGLYLQNNNLNGAIPYALGDLVSLKDLDLHNNHLSGKLPSSLGMLSNLRYLNISNNQFKGEIPSELLNLTILNYLNLKGNQFIYADIEALYSELSYIPDFIISSEMLKMKDNNVAIDIREELKEQRKIVIDVLKEEELAFFEIATLKIVGTEEYGDSLAVKDEGVWSIDNGQIIFTPLESFKDTPKSIFYTIENNEGVESNPIEISIKSKALLDNYLIINILGDKSNRGDVFSSEILFSEEFSNKEVEFTLSKDRKKLTIEKEGVWKIGNNGTLTFSAEEGFLGKPTSIEYLIFGKNGEKLTIGKVNLEDSQNSTSSLGVVGVNGLILMMFLGALFGILNLRENENRKL